MIAPVIQDKFYVTEKFQEKDSISSIATDSYKSSNVSMASIGNSSNMGNSNASMSNSHMSGVEQLNLQMTVLHTGNSNNNSSGNKI
jgi:hypothetical protein